MKPSVSPAQASYRDICVIAVLIVGVCCFALTPAMYMIFRALQWEQALRIVEAAFFPAFLLFGVAALLAYQRNRARQALWDDDSHA